MNRPLRILILEDNESDVELIRRELSRAGFDFVLRRAEGQTDFIKALIETTPDVILLDYVVPDFDGMTALSLVRERADTPVIIVSGAIGEETAVETLRAGATDYVLKGRLSRLGPAVHKAVEEARERVATEHPEEPDETLRRQLRLLILEDNPSDIELLQRELKKAGLRFLARSAGDEASFLQALDEMTPDLILADYSLPGYDGMTALLDARERFPEIPVIIVSGAIGEETAIETLKAGATDYVLKQRMSRLGPTVSRALRESRELSERKSAEHILRSTTQRLTTVVENSPLAMIEWDVDYRVVRWTKEAERLFGWTEDEMIGQDMEDVRLIHPQDLPDMKDVLRDMQAGTVPRSVAILRNLRKDGSTVWCEWYKSALYDESGKVEGIIALVLDMTDKIRAQEVLHGQIHYLQQALLPTHPTTGRGYEVSSYYVPAHIEEEVGGDFYDVFYTEAGRIAVIMGDVSGKGIPAAALAAVTRSTIRAFEFELNSTAEALTHANKILASYSAGSTFVTAHAATIDPVTGDVDYSSAGHPPPAIYRAATGKVEWLNHGDLPLRVFDEHVYQPECAHLEPGDKMLFYTDGLSETRSETDLFGLERIEAVFHEYGHLPCSEVVESVVAAADDFASGDMKDDTAILVIERKTSNDTKASDEAA